MKKVFRDNVHGDIFIDNPLFLEIINTPEMQRLRRIFQLGGAQFAYSSATHTRFMHCLGVFQIVNKFLENSDFEKIDEHDKNVVRLAGLMHDIGHGPFSHTFEKITNKNHESYSAEIIKNPHGNIVPILKKYDINPDDVVAILEGTYKVMQLNLLVSSQLDADRIDYLMRDSYYCGVNYASLDTEFLIRNAKMIDDKIVYPIKTIYAIESYLLGRYHMYKQVYEHKISIAFDGNFKMWFKRVVDLYNSNYNFKEARILKYFSYIFENKDIPLEIYLQLDDMTLFDILKCLIEEEDQILSDLSSRLVNRKLFKFKEADEIKVREIKNRLKEQNLDLKYYFADVELKRPTIYKDGIIDGKNQTIYIEDKMGHVKSFSKYSLLAGTIKNIEDEKVTKKYLFPKEIV